MDLLTAQFVLQDEFLPGFCSIWDEWADAWHEYIEHVYMFKGLTRLAGLIKANCWYDARCWSSMLMAALHTTDGTNAV